MSTTSTLRRTMKTTVLNPKNKCYAFLVEQADVEEISYEEYNNSFEDAQLEE